MLDNITAARPYAKAVFETAQLDSSQAAWSEVLNYLSSMLFRKNLLYFIMAIYISFAIPKDSTPITILEIDILDKL